MEPGGTLSAVPSHEPGPGRDAGRLAVRAFGFDETAHRRNGGGTTIQILTGDCMDVLPTLPAQSVQCCVTSPPYWGLRDYGTAEWEGGDEGCDHRSPTMRDRRNEDRPMLAGSAATNSAQLLLAAKSICGKCGIWGKRENVGQYHNGCYKPTCGTLGVRSNGAGRNKRTVW